MSSHLQTIVADVEAAVTGGDAERRRAMLRNVAGLFAGQAARLNEDQVDAFDAVITRLAREIETDARAELSHRLAGIANAPRATVRDLAFDDSVAVAGPVLERSNRLSEDDLVQVAGLRGQGHLMAMTRRSTLTERITDVLVVRGDQDVVRSVARNDGALFSERGHDTMVKRAVSDPELQATLERRSDVPPAYRKRLVELAQERARQSLDAEFGEASTDAVSRAAAQMRTPMRDDALRAAERAVDAMVRMGDLTEVMVCQWLSAAKETEALVATARLAGVPSRVALHAYEAEGTEPLLILVRAAKCGWRTLKLFLTAKMGRPPSPQEMQGAMEAFQALAVATAQRVVRFSALQGTALETDGPVPPTPSMH